MPLPVLSDSAAMGVADLLRQASQVELRWSEHLADAVLTDVGQVFASASLATVAEANCVLDARTPSSEETAAVLAEVEAVFSNAGSQCLRWAIPPGQPFAEWMNRLSQAGYSPRAATVYHLRQHARAPARGAEGVKILSARAAPGPYAKFAQQESPDAHAAAAKLLHLDDGHYDVLVAIADGRVHGSVGIYSMGQIGAIREWHVAEPHRRRGLGRLLLERALDHCARSLFRHVLTTVTTLEPGVQRLLHRCGFVPIGELPHMDRL